MHMQANTNSKQHTPQQQHSTTLFDTESLRHPTRAHKLSTRVWKLEPSPVLINTEHTGDLGASQWDLRVRF
jgi:hypothetical protein